MQAIIMDVYSILKCFESTGKRTKVIKRSLPLVLEEKNTYYLQFEFLDEDHPVKQRIIFLICV